ncbi:MAG TPA: glycerophosphodiester phosphodiesterase [Pirellulales bacterium]|nr:glycerophosphodiester phosphodiesterase [Pirellulales bacterium]
MALAQQVIAHRGASYDAPENTLTAFRLAWQQGADGIEGDFYLTTDNEIVCLHDSDTGRTGDRKLAVGQSTLEELRKVDVGMWKGDKFKGERIPTLAEVLAVVPPGKRIFVEVKCGPQIMPKLKEDLQRSGLKAQQVAIISFHPSVIEAARKQLPDIRAYYLYSMPAADQMKWPRFDPTQALETMRMIKASGLDLGAEHGRVTKDEVRQLRSAGYEFHCWTIDDQRLALEYQALGADSITTNRPALLRKFLMSGSVSLANTQLADPPSE